MSQVRTINDQLQKIAIEELHEVPEHIPANLEALKTWIKQQPHLRARTDDQFLLSFLRGCKHSLQNAKSKLDMYYMMRTKFPHIFRCTDVDRPKFRKVHRLGYAWSILPMPLFGDGPRICFSRCGLHPCDEYSAEDILIVIFAIYDILLMEDDQLLVNGIVFLFDLEKLTASHLFQLTPFILKKIAVYGEQGTPFRIKGLFFFNAQLGFDRVFNIFKPMLSAKLQKRLWAYGNKMDSMYKKIPKQYWPKEYGGENGSIEEILIHWDKKIDEYRDYFKNEINYGSDEELRCGEPIDFNNDFGLEGSFRKLNVD